MTTIEIEVRIRAILGRVARLEGEYSRVADLFRELGMKSVAALDLLLSLEEEFGVSIADEAFGDGEKPGGARRARRGAADDNVVGSPGAAPDRRGTGRRD